MTIWREELAWSAGFYDGEGNSGLTTQGYPRISIGQIERTTLDRFRTATNVGTIYGPYARSREEWNDIYMYIAKGFQEVQAVAVMLWPFLSEPKRAQLMETLTTCKKSNVLRCRSNLHVIDEVGRIDNRCASCYRMKHPRTKLEAAI